MRPVRSCPLRPAPSCPARSRLTADSTPQKPLAVTRPARLHVAMGPLDDLWPLFRLRVRTGALELRLPGDSDLAALAELAREPIHDPDTMPFSMPWTDQPPDDRARGTAQWHWKARGEWSPSEWRLELVAARDGEVVGTQALHGSDFPVTRQVDSGRGWAGGFKARGWVPPCAERPSTWRSPASGRAARERGVCRQRGQPQGVREARLCSRRQRDHRPAGPAGDHGPIVAAS